MATDKIIKEAADPAFCQRVAFLAIRMANDTAGDSPDEASSYYANRVLSGSERVGLLVMHVIAASAAISDALDNGTAADVSDDDIEAALKDIWSARASALGYMPEEE